MKMDRPRHGAVPFLNEWMSTPSMGSVFLLERDRDVWELTEPSELLALDGGRCDDLLSKWMSKSSTTWFHRFFGRHFKAGTHQSRCRRSLIRCAENEAGGLHGEHRLLSSEERFAIDIDDCCQSFLHSTARIHHHSEQGRGPGNALVDYRRLYGSVLPVPWAGGKSEEG